MKNKKSYISLFMLVVILILILVLISVLTLKIWTKHRKLKDINTETKLYITNSLKHAGEVCVFRFGYNGCNDEFFSDWYDFQGMFDVPYYYYLGNDLSPNIEESQVIIERCIKNYLPMFIDNFSQIQKQNVKIIYDYNNMSVDVTLGQNDVVFKLNWPIVIIVSNSKSMLDKYQTSVLLRLKDMIKISHDIINLTLRDDSLIRWDYMKDIMERDHFDISAYGAGNNTIIYQIIDRDYDYYWGLYGGHRLLFAVKVNPNA